jgi:transcriptional regulator with XRE-family HTH domain
MAKILNRLRSMREARDKTLLEVADEVGISHVQLSRLEKDQRDLKVKMLPALGRALRVPPEDIIAPAADVPVVGTIGVGGQVFEARRNAPASRASDTVKAPRGADAPNTAALRIAGRALEPLLPADWIAFYEPGSEHKPDQMLDVLCIVRFAGGSWLKQIKRGPSAGRYNLVSAFAPLVEDARVTWCAPVLAFSSSALSHDSL